MPGVIPFHTEILSQSDGDFTELSRALAVGFPVSAVDALGLPFAGYDIFIPAGAGNNHALERLVYPFAVLVNGFLY